MRSNYEALNLDLLFLSLIDMKGDTIFNVTRLKEINNELLILEDEHPIEDYKNLEVFIDAVNSTIIEGQSTYIRISCDVD